MGCGPSVPERNGNLTKEEALADKWLRMHSLPKRLRADKDVVLKAVSKMGSELVYASSALKDDRDVVWAAVNSDNAEEALQYASKRLRDDKEIVLIGVATYGMLLEHVSARLRNDKDVVLTAVQQTPESLKFASKAMRSDKEIVLVAIESRTLDFESLVAETLRGDKDVVLAALNVEGDRLEFASDDLKDDEEVVLAAVQKYAYPFQFASQRLRSDRKILLAAVSVDGRAFDHASKKLRSDKEVVNLSMEDGNADFSKVDVLLRGNKQIVRAALKSDGRRLEHVSKELQADKEMVMLAVETSDGYALKYASKTFVEDTAFWLEVAAIKLEHINYAPQYLLDDREFALKICSFHGMALQHVNEDFRHDLEVVIAACRNKGSALWLASDALRANKELVVVAATTEPEALNFSLGGLNQDPDCLRAAKLWVDEQPMEELCKADVENRVKIVLSTKFSLNDSNTSFASQVARQLQDHPYVRDGNYLVYSPNAWNKNTCDPEWTSMSWPCRGTFETCCKNASLKTGLPQPLSCWRYSYRYQLEQAQKRNGFMVQVVDINIVDDNEIQVLENHALGDGQKIETVMAKETGTKVFRIFQPQWHSLQYGDGTWEPLAFGKRDIEKLISSVREWYAGGCQDMTECEIRSVFYKSSGRCMHEVTVKNPTQITCIHCGQWMKSKRDPFGKCDHKVRLARHDNIIRASACIHCGKTTKNDPPLFCKTNQCLVAFGLLRDDDSLPQHQVGVRTTFKSDWIGSGPMTKAAPTCVDEDGSDYSSGDESSVDDDGP